MSVVVPADVHQQNISSYCGAACAQMVLAAMGIDAQTLAQRALYDASHDASHPVFWFSHPHTLTKALNQQWRNGANLRFRLFRCADKSGVNQVLRQMFEQSGNQHHAVGIVLTGLSRHWAMVRGFETAPADPAGPTIGFHLRDPAPAIGTGTEDNPHYKNDGCCTGHVVCGSCHYMSISYWNSSLRPVKAAGPWHGEYLVICPDAYVPGRPDEETVPAAGPVAVDAPPSGPRLSAQAIAELVHEMLASGMFVGVDCITDATRLTQPSTPILVEGLNEDGGIDPDGAYYLVPFVDPEGNWGDPGAVPVAMTVNAFTGEFEEVIAVPDGSIYDRDWITADGAGRQARANSLDALQVRAAPDSEFPYLAVWRSTEQTPTRFWPLFVPVQPVAGDPDGGAAPAVFMRVDGEVVTTLDERRP